MFSVKIREKSIRKTKPLRLLSIILVAAVALILGAATPQVWARQFAEAVVRLEINATDGDAGAQIFLDGEGWQSVRVFDPDGNELINVTVNGGLVDNEGVTELFLESAEPEFDGDEGLQEILDRFPEGKYEFEGETVDGQNLKGKATLTHDIPAGPVIVSPQEGDDVNPENAVITWEAVDESFFGESINVVGYQVIVELEKPLRVFSVDLPASDEQMSVTVPPEFLEPGTTYKFEVLAIEVSGNQTITESEFETATE